MSDSDLYSEEPTPSKVGGEDARRRQRGFEKNIDNLLRLQLYESKVIENRLALIQKANGNKHN